MGISRRVWFEYEVVSDHHANREARADGDRRLDVQRTPDDLLADLTEALRRPLAKGLDERILVVAGSGFGADVATGGSLGGGGVPAGCLLEVSGGSFGLLMYSGFL